MTSGQTQVQDEIQALFDSQEKESQHLEITSSYLGVILRRKVKPVAIDRQRAVFLASCAGLEGCVHLHSTGLAKPVRARVKDLSPRSGMFSLVDFCYVEGQWKERMHERVQTKEPTYGTIRYQGDQFRATLLDVSMNGMGLLVGISSHPELNFQPNCSVNIDLQISPVFKWEKLGGAIHYERKTSRLIVRLGIRLYPKLEQARLLEKYIQSRLVEIQEEIEQSAIESKISSGIELQYF